MQGLLDFLSLVGVVIFVMVIVFAVGEALIYFLFEVLWYIAMVLVFWMIASAAAKFMKTLSRALGLGRYKRS